MDVEEFFSAASSPVLALYGLVLYPMTYSTALSISIVLSIGLRSKWNTGN